jgi:hypothetical protein
MLSLRFRRFDYLLRPRESGLDGTDFGVVWRGNFFLGMFDFFQRLALLDKFLA